MYICIPNSNLHFQAYGEYYLVVYGQGYLGNTKRDPLHHFKLGFNGCFAWLVSNRNNCSVV